MNIFFWTLQILLALHTAMGAFWKFSNPVEKAVPSLKAIPPTVWISMGVVELGLSLCLVIPAFKNSLGFLVPIAASCIALEMLVYCVIHLGSGESNHSPIIYWGVVAAICAFIAYGRFVLKPIMFSS